MNFFKRKVAEKPKENLVLYNLDRIKGMIARLEKDEGKYDVLHDYDSILSALDFVKRGVERNYNIHASFKCDYCNELFTGWMAHSNRTNHEIDKHPHEVYMFQAIVASAILDVGLKAIDDLAKPSPSKNEEAK